MGGRSSKLKGANAERELAKKLQDLTGLKVERNLEQTRSGGYDLNGIKGLAIEVKRQEKLAINSWWKQTVRQAVTNNDIPVLAYRQSRKPWTFLVGDDKVEMKWGLFHLFVLEHCESVGILNKGENNG